MSIRQKNQDKAISATDFVPSLKIIMKIMKILHENGSVGKTNLALYTNLNYNRLARIVEWLSERDLVESSVISGKTGLALTNLGREFTSILSPN